MANQLGEPITFKSRGEGPLNIACQLGPTQVVIVQFGPDGYFTTDSPAVADYLAEGPGSELCTVVQFDDVQVTQRVERPGTGSTGPDARPVAAPVAKNLGLPRPVKPASQA